MENQSRWRKYIGPIIAAALIILYNIGIALVILFNLFGCIPGYIIALIVAVPTIVAVCIIAALISRIKEIQGGEEDDLSKY